MAPISKTRGPGKQNPRSEPPLRGRFTAFDSCNAHRKFLENESERRDLRGEIKYAFFGLVDILTDTPETGFGSLES